MGSAFDGHMRHSPVRGFAALVLASAVIFGCTDAPEAPVGTGRLPAVLAIQPTFNPALLRSSAATDALAQAFDQVNRFRMIVKRLSGEVVVDIIIEVTPGQESHELSAEVPMQQATETFTVDLIAMVGSVELFRSEGVAVQAVSGGVTESASSGDAELEYVGPGATASVVTVSPLTLVMGPGGSTDLSADVFDDAGNQLSGVPFGWESDDPTVASVVDGTVTAVSDGRARVVATTPTGLQAGADLYVVDGEIAFTRDGTVFTGSVSGSGGSPVAAGTQPTFSPDGSTLFYSAGGRVIRAGGSTLAGGLWPSVSPDGTKIAFERAAKVRIGNIDGSELSEGPAGFGPQWASSGDAFLVDGGGIERVDADGTNRASVIAGPTGRPAVGGGRLAYVANGRLFVASEDGTGAVEIVSGVSGRPSLSPDGSWVIGTTDSGLVIAPANGTGPALPLLYGEASHPAWKGTGNLMSPAQVAITGLNPANPGVGEEVEILGSGFDVIIPGNNSVSFTTANAGASSDGPARAVVETPITGVSRTGIRTTVPEGIIPGPITVRNFSTSATFEFDPPLGTINVSVMTTSGHPVEGASVTLTDSNDGARTVSSNAAGTAAFTALPPSQYTTTEVVPPAGFSLVSVPAPAEISFGQTLALEALLRAEVLRIELDPAAPALEVGTVTEVTVKAFDGLGNPVTDPASVTWQALTPARALFVGGGLTGRLLGVLPSPAAGANDVSFQVTVEGVTTQFSATVSTFVGGFTTDAAGGPFPGVPVTLKSGAGATLGSQNSGPDGAYHFGGLFPGTFHVSVTPPARFLVEPQSYDWTLDEATTAGVGDFVLTPPPPTPGGDIVVFNDLNMFDEHALDDEHDNEHLTANLVSYTGPGFRAQTSTEVWWDVGHSSSCSQDTCAADEHNMHEAVDEVEEEGMTVVPMQSEVGDFASIPPQVKVIWLWMPTVAYTRDEVNAFKKFASEGGRIVFIGEHAGFYPEFAIENQFLADLGVGMTTIGSMESCGRNEWGSSRIRKHQITADMSGFAMACASRVVPGPNDFPLFFVPSSSDGSGPDVPIAAVAKIDLTPLSGRTPAKIVSPVSRKKTHDPLGTPIGN
jgi:Prealbumin-like fold domain/WD40-like Beta Propeller Repeat